jgi:hypothetical protein
MSAPGLRTRKEAFGRIRKTLLAPQILLVEGAVLVASGLLIFGTQRLLHHYGLGATPGAVDFIMGFELALFFSAMLGISLIFTGGGHYFVGYAAERWTGKVLSDLGPKWRVFHGVPFSSGFARGAYVIDVDHIAVGPYGILVVETKYSSALLDLNSKRLDRRVQNSISQVEGNAARVRALLAQELPGVPIRPVVIYWGRGVISPANSVRIVDGRIENVRVVCGSEATSWTLLLRVSDGFGLSEDAINTAAAKIEKYQLNQSKKHVESEPSHS